MHHQFRLPDYRIGRLAHCHPMGSGQWRNGRDIREQANAGVPQSELAIAFHISRPLCNEIVRGRIWNPDVKVSTGDEMRDRIIGALDTGCRRGEMLKIQNKHVDWQHRRIRITRRASKTEVARGIPFEAGSRFEGLLRKRAFLGPDAYVFGEATTGAYVASCESAWQTLLLLANGIKPSRAGSGKRSVSNRDALARIDLRWHDLRHEALSRLADDGVPVHELQLLAGHSERHHHSAIHEREGNLVGGVHAPGARATSQTARRRGRGKCSGRVSGASRARLGYNRVSARCQPRLDAVRPISKVPKYAR